MLLNFIKLAGWQLSGVAIGWMKISPGGNLLCVNYPGGKFPGWEFSWVGVVRVGVFLGGNCPGGTYPGWEFSLVEVFRVGIVRWESSGWGFSCYHKTYHAANLYTLQSNLLL